VPTEELLTLIATGIVEVTGRPCPALSPDTDIASLGLDSLQTLELVSWAEERLSVRVPDEELTTMRSVGELSTALASRLSGGGS
jgi:acyl carrier protein